MSAPNAFADLIPATPPPAENSFADLIPKEQTNSFADLIPKQPDQSNSAFDPAMWSKVQGMKRGTKEHPSENYLTLTHIGSQLGFLGVHGFETTGHDPNGAHPTGDAVDFRTRDKSWEEGNQFITKMRKMGLTVIDERKKPGQPHIHVQVPRGGVFKGDFTPFNETPPTPIEPAQTHGTPIPFTQAEKEQMGQREGVYAPGTGPSTMSESSSRPGEWAPGLHMDIPKPGEPWYELNKTGNPLDSLRQSARDAQSIINNTLYQIGIPIGPSFPGTQAAAEFVNPLNQGNFALGAVMEPGKTLQGMAESVQNITKPGASLDERIGGIFTLAMVTGGLHGAVEGAGAFSKAVKSGDLNLAGKVLTDSGVHPDLAEKFVEKAWNEKQIEDLTNQRIEVQARTVTKSGKPKANVNPKDEALLNTLDSQIQALKPSPVSETAPNVQAPETAPSAPANNVSRETPVQPQEGGIRHADTEAIRAQADLEPYVKERQKVKDIWDAASPEHGDKVLADITNGKNSINSGEQASLWKLSIDIERNLKAAEDAGDHDKADALLAKKLDTLNALDKLGGSEAARTLGLRRFIAEGLDSESSIVRRWRNAKGVDLSTDEYGKARQTAEAIAKAKSDVERTNIEAAKNAAQAELGKAKQPKTRSAQNKIFTEDRFNAAKEVWRSASKERHGRVGAEIVPGASLVADILSDPKLRGALTDIVGYHIEKGVRSIPVLVHKVREALGDVPVDAVRGVVDDVTQAFNDAGVGKTSTTRKTAPKPRVTLDADTVLTPAEVKFHNESVRQIAKEMKSAETTAKNKLGATDIQAKIEAGSPTPSEIGTWITQEIRKGEVDAATLMGHAKRLDSTLTDAEAYHLVADSAKGARATKTGDIRFRSNTAPRPKTPEQLEAIGRLQKLRESIAKKEQDYGGNKLWRSIGEVRKASVLSDMLGTNLKLASTGLTHAVMGPLEELVSIIPKAFFKKSLGSADVESGFSLKAEGKAAAAFATAYPRLIMGFVRGKAQGFVNALHELELAHGTPGKVRFGGPLTKFFYEQHRVMKNPLERSAFARTYAKLAEKAARQGADLTSEDVVGEIGRKSYEASRQAIFMNDNAFSSAWGAAMSIIEKKSPGTAAVGRFLAPIVKVPTNIAGRFLEYNYGLEYGATKHIAAIRKYGTGEIPPAEADAIIRAYKRGGVGAGLTALGYYGLSPVLLQGSVKGKAGSLQPGQITLQAPGTDYKYILSPFWSHILGHAPALSPIAIGATARQYRDGGMSEGAAWFKALTIGSAKEGASMPMMQTLSDLRDMGQGRMAHPGAMIGKALIPQAVQGYKRFEESGNRGPMPHAKDFTQDLIDQGRPITQSKWQTEMGRLGIPPPRDEPLRRKGPDGTYQQVEPQAKFEVRSQKLQQARDKNLSRLIDTSRYREATDEQRARMIRASLHIFKH